MRDDEVKQPKQTISVVFLTAPNTENKLPDPFCTWKKVFLCFGCAGAVQQIARTRTRAGAVTTMKDTAARRMSDVTAGASAQLL